MSGNLELSDTPLGQGDGIYPVGPGAVTLRFDDLSGQPGKRVKMMSYDMHESFKVVAKTLFWATTVTTDTATRAVLDPCSPPDGFLTDAVLGWSNAVSGFRTDGTLFCDGSFCGKFGAPPHGQSALHIPVHPIAFQPFHFSGDRKTFTVASTFVSKTDTPKQTAHLALAGREMKRSCVLAKVCM